MADTTAAILNCEEGSSIVSSTQSSDTEYAVKLATAKRVERLLYSMDADVQTFHDIQLITTLVQNRNLMIANQVSTLAGQDEIIASLRETCSSQLSTIRMQAETVLELELAKRELEIEVALSQDDCNSFFNPPQRELYDEEVEGRLHSWASTSAATRGTSSSAPSQVSSQSYETDLNSNIVLCVPPGPGTEKDEPPAGHSGAEPGLSLARGKTRTGTSQFSQAGVSGLAKLLPHRATSLRQAVDMDITGDVYTNVSTVFINHRFASTTQPAQREDTVTPPISPAPARGTSRSVVRQNSPAVLRLSSAKDRLQRKDEEDAITKMVDMVDTIGAKYGNATSPKKKISIKSKKRPLIVPKVFANIWKDYLAPEPLIKVRDPRPVVNWARLNPHVHRNLPKPEAFPVLSAAPTSLLYVGFSSSPTPFGSLPGIQTDLGIVAMPTDPVAGYVWDPECAEWVVHATTG